MGQDPNMKGGSRKWIIEEVDNSLRRLGTDYIDLYQIHRWDDATDIEETLSALTEWRGRISPGFARRESIGSVGFARSGS